MNTENEAKPRFYPADGEFFSVRHKSGTDGSWRSDVFQCIASGANLVLAKSLTERCLGKDYIFRFASSEWNFFIVEENILKALGVEIPQDQAIEDSTLQIIDSIKKARDK